MKTLIFEGAGWADADNSKSTDLGNCRIRATFENTKKAGIYLEMSCHSEEWHISHLFKTRDQKTNHTPEFKHLQRIKREYSKKSLLNFVNEELECSFDNIEVDNSDFDGFQLQTF